MGKKSIYKKLKNIEAAQSKNEMASTPIASMESKQKKKIHHIDFNALSKAYQQSVVQPHD